MGRNKANLNNIATLNIDEKAMRRVISDQIVVKYEELRAAAEESHNTWGYVDSKTLRHEFTNYDDIIKCDWYSQGLKAHGKAFTILVRHIANSYVTNQIVKMSYGVRQSYSQQSAKGNQELLETLIEQLKDLDNDCVSDILNPDINTNFILSSLTSLHKDNERYIKLWQENSERCETLEAEVQNIKSDLEKVNRRSAKLEKETKRLEIQNNGMSDRIYDLEDKLEDTEIKLEQTEVKLEQTEVKLEQTEVKLEQTEVRLEQTEVKLDRAIEAIEKAAEIVEKQGQQIIELRTELNDLKRSLSSFDWETAPPSRMEAEEIYSNGFRYGNNLISKVTQRLDSMKVEFINSSVHLEMVNQVVESEQFFEQLGYFTVNSGDLYGYDTDALCQALDALSARCVQTKLRLEDIKGKVSNRGKHLYQQLKAA